MGDSTTVGLGDPLPGGGWRGWASLLALAMDAVFINVAVNGATAADVSGGQLEKALVQRPHIASVLVGVNDTLRGNFRADVCATHLERTVAGLTAAGATVLTARMPDPGRMLSLPAALARPLARRIAEVNTAVDDISRRYGTVHVDLAGDPRTYERPLWSVDRLHPSEVGHRHIAVEYAAALTALGFHLPGRLTVDRSGGAQVTRRGQLWWLATRGTAWVAARSHDLVPQLVGLAAAEIWADLRRRPLEQPPRPAPVLRTEWRVTPPTPAALAEVEPVQVAL
ncbi:SGNH/GDSL hydrolase family protein [Fodinicola feengrottensis]|uniref:SGNH/GDSL hydrolase family protein n=1 Tax=Fodinicola feengrottensis TaxID=435914 RepID=UPI0031DA5B8D